MQPEKLTKQPEDPLKSYDFILNPEKPAKKSFFTLPGPGSSLVQRLAIIGGGLAVLLVILMLGYSVLFSKPDVSADIASLSATQTEILRIAALANSKAQETSTKTYAASVTSIVSSDKAAILDAAKKAGYTINTKDAPTKKNTETDKKLADAASSNKFDTVFTDTLTAELSSYSQEMSTLYNKVKSKALKAALNDAYSSSQLLIKEHTPTKQ